MIRVLIVDDHSVVRRGLEQMLATADGLEVVGSAANGEEAVLQAAALAPDIVLMDVSMPVMDGIAATRAVLADAAAADREMRVVVLTSFTEQRRVLDALQAGASGYILKDSTPDEVIKAVHAAHAGGAPLDPAAARVLLDSRRVQQPAQDLSPRESEVLALVATGLPNKQIARRLGISERTVKAHLTAVFQQLGVTDRTQAALWAKEHLPAAND
ncbi:MAG: response regulator transcription factor [Ilumatobacteraceae bacterium]